jgi:hypothetical protein
MEEDMLMTRNNRDHGHFSCILVNSQTMYEVI